jgi:hypothetical protein
MNVVIDKLVEVLAAPPGLVLVASELGRKRPAASADVPAVAIALKIESTSGNGLGRFIRAGDSLVQSTRVVEVQARVDSFDGALRVLRIRPLPLRRNPLSHAQAFTADDVQVKNVTTPAQAVDYQFADEPAGRETFRVDSNRAEIIFGAAQARGDKLAITHWTVAWRDEILGDNFSGTMLFEVWGSSFTEADGISRRLQSKLSTDRSALRSRGFLQIRPAALEPIENVLHTPPVGSTFPVWKQKLEYRFAFESEEGGELSTGPPIKRVDVGIDSQFAELFSVP